MAHKTLREKSPENLERMFPNRTQISKYETRRMDELQIPRPRLEISKKRFLYVGARVWNEISNEIRNVERAQLFKQKNENLILGPIK